MIPRMIRNAELTELPIIPPTLLYLSNFSDTAAAVAATIMDVIITMLYFGMVSVRLMGCLGTAAVSS